MPIDNGSPDIKRLIGEVAFRHGILMKPDDAGFALVTINRLVLEEVVEQINDRIGERIGEFERSAQKVEVRAGKILAQQVKESAQQIRAELQRDIDTASLRAAEIVHRIEKTNSRAGLIRWLAVGALSGITLLATGIWIGLHV